MGKIIASSGSPVDVYVKDEATGSRIDVLHRGTTNLFPVQLYDENGSQLGSANAVAVRLVSGSVSLEAGDIQIGAVEIKDQDTGSRSNVTTILGSNALAVDVVRLVALPSGTNLLGSIVIVDGAASITVDGTISANLNT